ncbi:unnamed protein product [Prunus armeniaca]|uniref:glucan endo-1,3-beta-D-glucosidase n=1 Tax=Prunus armeniaca TaxID=36596 RepID=A0A6J5U6C6_PRUAR|nr:unnamed protein product [Prunus armeniaca]CAB4301588.1 unnamed protein product [Prunus armeniaca]
MVDALHASLEKAGEPQVQVVVSERGWPSDGNREVTTPATNIQFEPNKPRLSNQFSVNKN